MEIAKVFGLSERALRNDGHRKGLCSEFAISSAEGLKHYSLATTSEFNASTHRLASHAIGELRRVRLLRRRRHLVLKHVRRPPVVCEKDSGQLVMVI
jgi:hypothetical protein